MFDCVCECTDFKHNFKSEKETKIAPGSLAELPRAIAKLCPCHHHIIVLFMIKAGKNEFKNM